MWVSWCGAGRCGFMISVSAVKCQRVGSIGVYGCLNRKAIIDRAYGCIECGFDMGDVEERESFMVGK